MKFSIYLKDKSLIIISNIVMMIFLSLYLIGIGNSISDIALILIAWVIIFVLSYILQYFKRKRFLEKVLQTCENLEERYLILELMEKPHTVDDIIYQRILWLSNKSMIERITKVKEERKDYTKFIEKWVHEIKTPLAAMKLICDNNKSDVSRKLLEELERTERYLEQVIFYARSEMAEKDYFVQEINLGEIVSDALKENKQLLLSHQISIDMDCTHLVFTDKKWIIFILSQIIINAVKYQTKTLKIYTEKVNNGVLLSIKDDGIGISEEDLPRVFDKGFTGENGRKFNKSTGIGLYLCKDLCKQLGLEIKIASKKEIFTEVKLIFPIGDFLGMEEE